MNRLEVTVADGKYTIIQDESGGTRLLRHGKPWLNGANNVEMALAYEVQELREELSRVKKEPVINHYGLPPKEKTFIPLSDGSGWKSHTWYKAKVARHSSDPIFDAVLYSGYIITGEPGGYSTWCPAGLSEKPQYHIMSLHYVELTDVVSPHGSPPKYK